MTEIATDTRARVLAALREQRVETASWAYANSETRFKVFPQPGVPRTPEEKIDDAAAVHRFTGVAPTVALHIPWDRVDDYGALARYARDRGVRLGAAKIPAVIRSVLNVQEATAKALLVDRGALAARQRSGDVLGANAVLMDAYNTDVRPLLAELRADMGLDPDPVAAYAGSGYQKKINSERAGGQQAGWGA